MILGNDEIKERVGAVKEQFLRAAAETKRRPCDDAALATERRIMADALADLITNFLQNLNDLAYHANNDPSRI